MASFTDKAVVAELEDVEVDATAGQQVMLGHQLFVVERAETE